MTETGRILLADDEELVLRTTAALLEAEGFTCDCASNARSVHELMEQRAYDLLITDWKMSGNANLEMVRALHESGNCTPVILVTGYPHLLDEIRHQKLRVFAHVVKPFEFDEFLEVVREGIAHRCRDRTSAPDR